MPLRCATVLLNESHLVDFAQCGQALLNFVQTAFAQRNHAFVAGDALDFRSRPAIDNHFADAVGQIEQFANCGAAMIAGARTFETARAFGERRVHPFFGLEACFANFIGRKFFQLFAIAADNANEALRQNTVQGRDEIVRLDAHVNEAANDVGHVIGVNGGENEVAGEGGLNGDLRGFLVADFADHDFVGVVAQDGAQSAGESQAFFLVDGTLRNAAKLIFDGVFNRDDFVFVGFDFVDGGVERSGFTGTGRTGDENHAIRLANVAAEAAHLVGGETNDVETQALKLFGKGFLVEDAKHGVFAVAGRHDGDTQVNKAAFVFHAEAAVLRNTALGNVEIAEHLDARNDGRMPVFGNGRHGVLENAVNTVFDGDFAVTRFNVNVACAALEGGEDDGFDQFNDGARGGVSRNAIAGERFIGVFVGLAGLQRERFGGLFEDALRLFGSLEQVANLARSGNFDGELFAEEQLKFVGKCNLAGFGNGDRENVVVHLERNEVVAEHQVGLNGAEEFRIDALFAQIHKRETVTFGKPAGMFALVLLFGAEVRRSRDRRILMCRTHVFRSS